MTSYLIGIDNGSQSTKVTIFDEHGTPICEGKQPLRPNSTPKPGIVEHPDDDLWDSIGEASRRAMKSFSGDIHDIVGVGLCTIRFCRALLRADGTLAGPVMSWMDSRVSRPYEHVDDAVRYVTTSSGYISHRMTGEFKDTASNYQGMWPINTDRWEWLADDEGFSECGIPREMLFDLVMPGELLGQVTAAASEHTRIPAGLPVFATGNDKAVEALGSGLRTPETLLVSLGTYIASMALGERNLKDARSFWTNFACIPRQYLYESTGIRRGMWTVSWWRDVLGESVKQAAAARQISPEEYLNEQASKVPAGSDGLMVVLDWLAPTEAPFRKGSILGFDGRQGPYHIYRAIIEGIALTICRCGTEMGAETRQAYDRLIISGGGSNSDLIMQIFADTFGLPAVRARVNNSVGLASAICAAVGSGIYDSFDAAAQAMVAWQPPFTPDPARHELYQKMLSVYSDIRGQTDPLFERSYAIFD
jgi:sugar (pentulose or hexulose) kinase